MKQSFAFIIWKEQIDTKRNKFENSSVIKIHKECCPFQGHHLKQNVGGLRH